MLCVCAGVLVNSGDSGMMHAGHIASEWTSQSLCVCVPLDHFLILMDYCCELFLLYFLESFKTYDSYQTTRPASTQHNPPNKIWYCTPLLSTPVSWRLLRGLIIKMWYYYQ